MASPVSTSPMIASLAEFRAYKQAVVAAEQAVVNSANESLAFNLVITAIGRLSQQRKALQVSLRNCTLRAVEYCETATLAEVVLVLQKKPRDLPNEDSINRLLMQEMQRTLFQVRVEKSAQALPQVFLEITRLQKEVDAAKEATNQLSQDGSQICSVVAGNEELKAAYGHAIRLLAVRIEQGLAKLVVATASMAKRVGEYVDRGGDLEALTRDLFRDAAAQRLFIRQATEFLKVLKQARSKGLSAS